MTSLLEGTDRLVTRGTDIGARIDGLDGAAQAARGRLDDGLVDAASGVVERAAGRLRLSANHTVVGIAGATGSGTSGTAADSSSSRPATAACSAHPGGAASNTAGPGWVRWSMR